MAENQNTENTERAAYEVYNTQTRKLVAGFDTLPQAKSFCDNGELYRAVIFNTYTGKVIRYTPATW